MASLPEDLIQTTPEAVGEVIDLASKRAPTPEREDRPLTKDEIYRPALGALMTTLGCAFMVGGMFSGIVTPRVHAGVGAIVGVAAAVWAARATKRENLIQGLALLSILFVGLLALGVGGGFGAVSDLGGTLGEAAENARLTRPPVAFLDGWRAVLPWSLGMIGFAAASIATLGRKPAVGLLFPILFTAFAAIAQPDEAQVPAGIIAFVTFLIGLAIIYRADRGEGEGVSTAYELKRAMRTAPLAIVLVGALAGLSQTNLLFPEPRYDPTQRAQLPQAVTLKGVEDKLLFETQGDFTGPWRMGILSVYDGEAWRLPPYAESDFEEVPVTGGVGEAFGQEVSPDVSATLTVHALEGVVLPLPSRMNAIRMENAPTLVTDGLAQTIRIDGGQVANEMKYEVVFALLPTEKDLEGALAVQDQAFLAEWTDTAGVQPPPAVQALLAKAPQNTWLKLDFLRKTLLQTVTAAGAGVPAPVPADKVQDMLAGSKEGTPYEIVAAQVLMARWAGVPARIGYGFDGGKDAGAVREFRPTHGSQWLEVYFEGYGWFPVTGLPEKARATLGTDEQQRDVVVLPSGDIGVQLFLPLRKPPAGVFFKQAQKVVLLALPFVAVILLVWLLWPVWVKARRRSRRQAWALQAGRAVRIGVAYAEFRDLATDLGVGDPYATPLMYLDKVVSDEEHRELAWLVTRCLWGDLRDSITDDEVLAAEELSRSLRRRIFEAQPFTIRGISLVSRLSLRNPYAPELLSPPLEKVSLVRWVTSLVRHITFGIPRLRKKKESADEAVESA